MQTEQSALFPVLSHLQLAEKRHIYITFQGSSMWCKILSSDLALFCDILQTGEKLHSANFLLGSPWIYIFMVNVYSKDG